VVALGLGLWTVFYFTSFRQPILYIVAAAILFGVTILRFRDGTWQEPFNLMTVALDLLFVALAVYLFGCEEVHGECNEEKIEEKHTTEQ
jgi:predicted membrane protein